MRLLFLLLMCALALDGAQAFNFTKLQDAASYLNVIDDTYMDVTTSCGEEKESQNGYVYSHLARQGSLINVDIKYGDSSATNCLVAVDVGEDYRAVIQFFGNISVGAGDNFTIYDGDNSSAPILLSVIDEEPYDSVPINTTGSFVTFHWQTNGDSDAAYGFKVFYSAFRTSDTCNLDEFSCDRDRCIPESFICDGAYQCLDEADENSDTCTAMEKFFGMLMRMGLTVVIVVLLLLLLLIVALITVCAYLCCCRKKKTKVTMVKA